MEKKTTSLNGNLARTNHTKVSSARISEKHILKQGHIHDSISRVHLGRGSNAVQIAFQRKFQLHPTNKMDRLTKRGHIHNIISRIQVDSGSDAVKIAVAGWASGLASWV